MMKSTIDKAEVMLITALSMCVAATVASSFDGWPMLLALVASIAAMLATIHLAYR